MFSETRQRVESPAAITSNPSKNTTVFKLFFLNEHCNSIARKEKKTGQNTVILSKKLFKLKMPRHPQNVLNSEKQQHTHLVVGNISLYIRNVCFEQETRRQRLELQNLCFRKFIPNY